MTAQISTVPINTVNLLADTGEIMTHLSNGDVLRVHQENQCDVELSYWTAKHKNREVSRDLEQETRFYKCDRVLYNVSISLLLTFDTYLEDFYMESTKAELSKNTIVEYIIDNQVVYVAKVLDIFVDNSGNYCYALSGNTGIYIEDPLNKIKN
ncbi:structural protein [Staphylococcus phage vB_SauH_DELF3]|nr:structural protein [Staphylococcus phage vB_SauH_DELF3]